MKRKAFYIYICSFSTTIICVISVSDTRLRRRKPICIPNFDETSHASAEI